VLLYSLSLLKAFAC